MLTLLLYDFYLFFLVFFLSFFFSFIDHVSILFFTCYSRRTLILCITIYFVHPFFMCSVHEHAYSNGWSYWILNAIGLLILLFFLSITWFKKMWILLTPINEDDPNLIELPANPFLKYLFNTSKSVMSNAVARMLIYFVAVCVLTLSALIHLVSER